MATGLFVSQNANLLSSQLSEQTLGSFTVIRKYLGQMLNRSSLKDGLKKGQETRASLISVPGQIVSTRLTVWLERFFFAFGSGSRICLGKS